MGVGGGQDLTRFGLQRSEHVARLLSSTIINLLPGSTGWGELRDVGIHQLLAWITLDADWPHLVQTHAYTVSWRRRVDRFDCPLFLAKSGSTRSPNQVSSWRQLSPSAMKISLIRLRLMRMPLTRWRCSPSRSSVHMA